MDQTASPGGSLEKSWTTFQEMVSVGGRATREGGTIGTGGGGGGARGSTLLFQLVPDGPEVSAGAEPAEGPAASPLPAVGPEPGSELGAQPPPLGLPGGGPGVLPASGPGPPGGQAGLRSGEAGAGEPST